MRWLVFIGVGCFTAGCGEGGDAASSATSGGGGDGGVGPVSTILAEDQSQPVNIAVDATTVYWANVGNGTIMRVPLDGGTPDPLAPDGHRTVAVANDRVYWITDAKVMALSLVDEVPVALASIGLTFSNGMAVDDSSVYWTDFNDGYVRKVPIGGGMPTTLAIGDGTDGIALDATRIYWADRGPWQETHVGSVHSASLDGNDEVTLADGLDDPLCVAVDDAYVYWTVAGVPDNDYADAGVMRAKKDGSEPPEVLASSGGHHTECLAIDDNSIYWAVPYDGIHRLPKAGGDPEIVATDDAAYLALDATHVYFTDNLGKVRKIAK